MILRRFSLLPVLLTIIAVSLIFTSCAQKYSLTVSGATGGSVSLSPSDGTYKAGTVITLTASAASGYYFTGWGNIDKYSEDYATDNSIEIIMPEQNLDLSVGFAVPGEGWTFMLYMSGDQIERSLSTNVGIDLNEMEEGLWNAIQAGNPSVAGDVRVLALTDRKYAGDSKLYLVAPDNTLTLVSSEIVDGPYTSGNELNMGDPDTLKSFIQYSMARYPSEYNALVLWNHGGGVKSLDFSTADSREICSDDESDDVLFLNELDTAVGQALSGNGGSIDIIGMDACIMGEVETAYELRDHTDYFVASMANEWGEGWDYTLIFDNFSSAGNPPAPSSMADILVRQYKESTYGISNLMPNTLTAVKTAGLENLKNAIDDLADLLYDPAGGNNQTYFESARDSSVYYFTASSEYEMEYNPYYDLYSFCEQIEGSLLDPAIRTQAGVVKTALAASVAACYADSNGYIDLDYYYETDDSSAVRGLSILIPFDGNSTAGYPYYSYAWWYVSTEHQSSGGYTLGGLDFCTYDDSGDVETWRELFEAWYDNYASDGYTPGNY